LTQGSVNPTGVSTGTPYFSAICNDPDAGDTLNKYQIQVSTDASFGSTVWDSGSGGTSMADCTTGARSSNITYGGTALALNGARYYWRIKFWDADGNISPFSNSVDTFSMADATTGILDSTSCTISKTPNDTSLTLLWSNSSTTQTQFRIEKDTDSAGFTFLVNEAAAARSHLDSVVSSGHTYQYRVRAEGTTNSNWCTTNTVSLQLGDFNLKGIDLKGFNIQ
jgi:hypothetical protein